MTLNSAPKVQMPEAEVTKFLSRGYKALLQKDYNQAGSCAQLVLKYHPKNERAHFLVGLVAIEMRDWKIARQAFTNVVEINPEHVAGWAQLARAQVSVGFYEGAAASLEKATTIPTKDPMVLDVIGNVYSLLGEQSKALHWFDKAKANAKSGVFDLSRANALTFLGRVDEAEEALHSVLKDKPDAAMAHWMLSRLKKVKDDKHAQKMLKTVANMDDNNPDAPFIHYAIAKEFEDLERWDEAFEAYAKGAKAKRAQVIFDEQAEIELFNALEKNFDEAWFKKNQKGHEAEGPIFIIGQPRTGTTLTERIITAHSDVASAGELQQFAMAIKRVTEKSAPKPMTADIIRHAAVADVAKIGETYLNTIKIIRPDTPYFIDKLPVNYMYAPLIAAALPNAKIIHIVRNPADSCFASYKQLFADAYFHSYDQEEMARHHIRYRHLMEKWRTLLGDRMLEIQYENLVDDLEGNARKIIKYIGLNWQDACLNFHLQEGAVTTASATQVREKAHTKSVHKWKKFEKFLAPLLGTLKKVGLT